MFWEVVVEFKSLCGFNVYIDMYDDGFIGLIMMPPWVYKREKRRMNVQVQFSPLVCCVLLVLERFIIIFFNFYARANRSSLKYTNYYCCFSVIFLNSLKIFLSLILFHI